MKGIEDPRRIVPSRDDASLLKHMPAMMHSIDAKGRLIDVSDLWLAKLGYRREEVIGRKSVDFLTPASRKSAQAKKLPDFFARGSAREVAYQFVRKNGEVMDVLLSASSEYDEDGAFRRSLAVLMDVTERNRLTDILRESERRYRSLIRQMTAGFALHEIICDDKGCPADYRFLEVNPAFEQLTGLAAGEILGKTILEVLPETESFWIESFGKVTFSRQPIHFEHFSRAFQRHFEVLAYSPFERQFAVVFTDVTERKRLEEVQRVQLELLRLVNQDADLEGMIDASLVFFKKWTGIDGIAIRIQQNDDFFFFRTRGLPESYWTDDGQFCDIDRMPGGLQGPEGVWPPACLCRRVIENRFAATATFLTDKGSFWTNDISAFLSEVSTADLPPEACRRCCETGFASMLLVLLRERGRTIGLLQLHNKRKDRFKPDFVVLVEHLADYIAVALAQRMAEDRLKAKKLELEESNAALKVLIRNREEELLYHDRTLMANIQQLVIPGIERLKRSSLSERQKTQLNILENNLQSISSPLAQRLASPGTTLTPALVQVADLVKKGFTNKDIGTALDISVKTVETYRKRIRQRLSLTNSRINLSAYLNSHF